MLLTEVRVLLHSTTGPCSSCNFNVRWRSSQLSKHLQQYLKNVSHLSTVALLVRNFPNQRHEATEIGKAQVQHSRRTYWACGSTYHDRRKGIGHTNSLGLVKEVNFSDVRLVRAFSISTGTPSPTDGKSKTGGSTSKAISKQEGRGDGHVTLSVGEKVKENAKTATYGGVILLGIAVTCAMGYFILSELFSEDSPNNIYTKSFKLCKANEEVQDVLGAPIKCYGEETRRGWRRHVAHQQFLHGETKILRMRFYLEGKFNKATVHVEKKGNVNGKYEYSYLVVDVDGYPPRRITIDT